MINKIQTGTTGLGQFWDSEIAPLVGARLTNGTNAKIVVPKSVEGLGAKETELANKQIEQDSKGIDWAEFDKLD